MIEKMKCTNEAIRELLNEVEAYEQAIQEAKDALEIAEKELNEELEARSRKQSVFGSTQTVLVKPLRSGS